MDGTAASEEYNLTNCPAPLQPTAQASTGLELFIDSFRCGTVTKHQIKSK